MLKPFAEVKNKVDIELVIDNLPCAIIVVNKDRRVLLGNKMAEIFANKTKVEFFGLSGGEAFGCVNSKTNPKGCGFAPACEFCTLMNTVYSNIKKIKGQVDRMGEITRKLMTITRYKTKDYLKGKIIDIYKASKETG